MDVQIETRLLGNSLTGLSGFSTHTLDVSAGGVRIAVPEELPLGLEIFLMLHLPGGDPHTARARVVRSSPWAPSGESGPWEALVFTDPSPALQAAARGLAERRE